MDDVRAVMDAVDSSRAVLFGYSESAPMAILFTATYPERARALVLYGAYAKRLDPDADYPWAPTREARAAYIERLERDWGFESDMKMMCPSADEALARWWGERCRAAASPGAIRALNEMNSLIDVRSLLPAIRVPTLVVHRGTDYDVRVEEGRYIAERIPGARFVELPGADHFVGVDPDQVLDVVEPFLSECRDARVPVDNDRVLVTLVATEIAAAATFPERRYESLLARHRGRGLEAAGDRLLASFDGPARAVRYATAIAHAGRALGIEVRTGVHTGEVEIADGRVRGVALDIALGVAAAAGPGEVLVSQTVTDLLAGSGLEFADRGTWALAGAPGEGISWPSSVPTVTRRAVDRWSGAPRSASISSGCWRAPGRELGRRSSWRARRGSARRGWSANSPRMPAPPPARRSSGDPSISSARSCPTSRSSRRCARSGSRSPSPTGPRSAPSCGCSRIRWRCSTASRPAPRCCW